jgi:hypothetical protein
MDFMDSHSMTRAPRPPYSPDFFLFEDVKRQLSGCSFDHADDPLTAVQEILHGFDKPTLIKVFEEWVRRLGQCTEITGGYVG